MNRNIVKIGLVALFALLVCYPATAAKYDKKLYKPTPSDATPNATVKQLKEGRELLINRCTKCHGVVSTDRYSVSDWGIIVNKMAPKSKLSDQEALLIYKYVTKGK